MPKKVCVIGATETIGYFVSNRLAVTGNPVKAIATNEALFKRKKYHPNIEKIVISDYSTHGLRDILKDVKACLIYKSDWKEQYEFSKIIVELAKEVGISHLVYISILGAGSEKMGAIGREYGEAEYCIENSGLGWTILRHNFLMQDLLTFMEQTTANFCFPTGKEHVSFIDARDVAVCGAEVMVSGFHFHRKIYSLTGAQSYSFKQCANILSKVSGTTLHYDNCDQKVFQRILEMRNAKQSELDYFLLWSLYAGSGAASTITKDVELLAGIESIAFEDFARDNAESIREFLEHGLRIDDGL